eukprot:1160311-Alexandrium_andersonii.AAC.1
MRLHRSFARKGLPRLGTTVPRALAAAPRPGPRDHGATGSRTSDKTSGRSRSAPVSSRETPPRLL